MAGKQLLDNFLSTAMSINGTRRTINNYSYYLHDKIGYGCSSEVFSGLNTKTGQRVAIKVIPKTIGKVESHLKMAQNQIKHLQALKGQPRVVQLKHIIQTNNTIYLVTELCDKGSLYDLIEKEGKLQESKAICLLRQIVEAVQVMTRNGVVHMDLKSTNFLIHGDNQLKVCDFGMAKMVSECEKPLSENVGSPLFMAPEALTRNEFSPLSDIWAIGIIFLEMLTGALPWKAKTQRQLANQLNNIDLNKIIPSSVSQQSKAFLSKCLQKDKQKRATVQALLKDGIWGSKPPTSESNNLIQDNMKKKERRQSEETVSSVMNQTEEEEGVSPTSALRSKKPVIGKGAEVDSGDTGKGRKKIMSYMSIICKKQAVSMRSDTKIRHRKASFTDESTGRSTKTQKQLVQSSAHIKNKQRKCLGSGDSGILRQIEGQIHYFRFMFKLIKKMDGYLKTHDEVFTQLKSHILSSVFIKIKEVRQLKHIKTTVSGELEKFRTGKQFASVQQILETYSERYRKFQEESKIQPQLYPESHFINLLTSAMSILYKNILQIEGNSAQLQRKRALVVVFKELLELSRVYPLNAEGNWETFAAQSDIEKLVEAEREIVSIEDWKRLKDQFLTGRVDM